MHHETHEPRRRQVLAGIGIGLAATAAACTTYGNKPSAAPASPAAPAPAASGSAVPAAAQRELIPTADVPVGSGVIVDDIVITQPTQGVFTGLSSVCTHAGCNVNRIADGVIVCPCHGSKFNLDGSVAEGPATKPLEGRAVAVRGGSVVLG